MSEPKVLIVSDALDGHARALFAAFAAAGASASRLDLADCGFDTSSPCGLDLPGFGGALPAAVLVRTLAAGSFEAITKRLGVLVWNEAPAIERCVDKSRTSFLLARARLPTPPTWTLESPEAARALVERETRTGPLVLKPLFGSQGKGLRLLRSAADLPAPVAVEGVYYLQWFEAAEQAEYRDYRLFVVGGRVVAAMMRRATRWITNVKRGGEPCRIARDATLERLALAAAEAVGADLAGVDILIGLDGRPTVLEVNSMPAWSGVQKVSDIDIAETIAAALLADLGRAR